jgi:Zn-dependent peptidase ImmA (M78 family)
MGFFAAPTSSRLLALKSQISGLASADRQRRRTALLAGLGLRPDDWFRRWDELRNTLESRCGAFKESIKRWFEPEEGDLLCVSGSCEAGLMFGSASPTLTEADVLTIATLLVKTSAKKSSSRWSALASDPQPLRTDESPWADGCRLARFWSEKANIRHKRGGAADVEEHLERLGVAVTDLELEDATTSGLAVLPEQGAPQIFVNRRDPRCEFPSGKRFTLAHELCHLLHDRVHGRNLAMISGPWAPRELEKRANAFAAALLMPLDLLKKRVRDGPDLNLETSLALAKRLEVSPDALAHHLKNCGLISEAARDVLLAQLVNRPESGKRTKSAR